MQNSKIIGKERKNKERQIFKWFVQKTCIHGEFYNEYIYYKLKIFIYRENTRYDKKDIYTFKLKY